MANDTFKSFVGSVALPAGSSQARTDVGRHMVSPRRVVSVDFNAIGAVANNVLIWVPNADIQIWQVRFVPSIAVSMGGNLPEWNLGKADLAAGSLTAFTNVFDATATNLVARTAVTHTLVSAAAAAVTKDQGIYITVATNGTPAALGNVHLTYLIDYDLVN